MLTPDYLDPGLYLQGLQLPLPLARVDDLDSSAGYDVTLKDGSGACLRLLIQRLPDGTIVGFENNCPHAHTKLNDTPLGHGAHDDERATHFLDSRKKFLLCRTHGALFHPETGKCVRGPCKGSYLKKLRLKVKDDQIYLLAP